MNIDVVSGPRELAARLALAVVEAAEEAVGERGRFTLALSGGSTPLRAYALLGEGSLSARMPWSRTVLLWGDERCVPADHPASNYGAAMNALGTPPGLAAADVHPIEGRLGPDAAAARYADVLAEAGGAGPEPCLDVILLGLGADGHTASLFPGDAALDVRDRAVTAVAAPTHVEPRVARVSLTLPALLAARRLLFAVSGADKAAVVRRVVTPSSEADAALPASRVSARGRADWLLDAEAARELARDAAR